jgi:hypothetical protein
MTGFQLEPFDFGPDEDGDPFRTFILSPELFAGDADKQGRQKPTDRQRLALKALAEVTLSKSREPPGEYHLPAGIKVVEAEAWREELMRCNVIDRSGNPWARFKELRNALTTRSLIGARDDLVWIAKGGAP